MDKYTIVSATLRISGTIAHLLVDFSFQYDTSTPPAKNIGLPDSLLSRFDFLFLVLDQKDAEIDRAIADHVVRMHRYRKPNADSTLLELECG